MSFRKAIFWIHLCAGVVAGIIILLMSVTGVVLTYEKQMIAWADGGYRVTPSQSRGSIEGMIESVRQKRGALPATLVMRSDREAPAEAAFGREGLVYVNPYSLQPVGEGKTGIRAFFRSMTDWHRWLGTDAEGRAVGRAITGACNLAFLFLVVSGFYLWFPREWKERHFRAVLWFRRGLSGKARDFNWHNAIGFWSAIPLFFIVLSGVVMSYPWANALVYKSFGSEVPPSPGQGAQSPARGPAKKGSGRGESAGLPRPQTPAGPPADLALTGIDAAWASAEAYTSDWQTITLRLPANERAPLAFTVDRGSHARPDLRTTLTIARGGAVLKTETYRDATPGRRARTWLRWIHTGEAGGLIGQTIAGLVSLGGMFLVYTGIALSLRRFAGWRKRTGSRSPRQAVPA